MKGMILAASIGFSVVSGNVLGDPLTPATFIQKRMIKHKISKEDQETITSAFFQVVKERKINTNTQYFLIAMMETESAFRIKAKSSANAVGLLQITPVAQIDAALHCNLTRRQMDRHKPVSNITLSICYLRWLKTKAGASTWVELLVGYNGGFGQVLRMRRGVPIACESANYVVKVLRLYNNREK